MRNSIGNTVGIMLLCFEILIMSECSSPGELCSSCMHGRKRDFKLAVRGPSTRHLPSTRSHSTTFGLSLVPKSTALHSTRTQTLPANVRCLQEPWRLMSGRRTMCGQLFLHPATRVSRLRTNYNRVLFVLLGRVQAQPPAILGRAGYALDFNAPQSVQWQDSAPSGPSIKFSSQTCTDSLSGCVCCEAGAMSHGLCRTCL